MNITMSTLTACTIALAMIAAPDSAASPRQVPPDLAPFTKSLEFLQIDYRLVDDGRQILFEVPTRRYGPPGNPRLWLNAFPFTIGDSPFSWYQLRASGIHSLAQCPHPDAARRAILETGTMLDTDVQFLYDGSNGEVGAQMAIPAPDGKIPASLLQSCIGMIVAAVDRLDPVLVRAMETGFIDWPARDRGPREPQGELKITPTDGTEPFTVSWAPWIEESVLASTLVTLDPFLRQFASMDDEARERLGRELTGFGGAAGQNSFAGWMRIADHLEQSYPPIAFRFWGPPGTRVSATARIEGFCSEATAEGVIDGMGHWDVEIMPRWDTEALVALEGPRKARVEFTVSCGDQATSGTKEVTIEPVSVADTGLGFLATAKFVNEDHPWVRSIISEANSLGIARSMGFTGQEPFEDCVRQVYAVWKAMRNRGIGYVTIHENADAAESPTQTIRQFHEAIAEQGANCADGSAAFASILRKLGFDVWLIHPERHVLIGIDLGDRIADPERRWLFLETTVLGDVEPEPIEGELAEATVESQVPPRHRGEDWGTFLVACESANSQIDDEDANCEWIRLRNARDLGLTPIPATAGRLGRIPGPPKDLESIREPLREAKRADRRVRDYLFRLADAPACVPYDDFEAIVSDIDSLESSPRSLCRLLSAIPGDGLVERLARALARQDAALAPAFDAANAAFGGLPGRGFDTFGIEGSPWEIEIEREEDSARINVRPLNRVIRGNWVMAMHESDRWFISGESLMENPASWYRTAMVEAAERMSPGSLGRLARELADRVNRREIADATAFDAALESGIEAMLPSEAKLRELAEREP